MSQSGTMKSAEEKQWYLHRGQLPARATGKQEKRPDGFEQPPGLYMPYLKSAARLSVYGGRQIPFSVMMPVMRLWSVTSKAGL